MFCILFCDYYSKINKSAETIRAHIIVRTLNKTFISHALQYTYIKYTNPESVLMPSLRIYIPNKMRVSKVKCHIQSICYTCLRICHMCVSIEIFW